MALVDEVAEDVVPGLKQRNEASAAPPTFQRPETVLPGGGLHAQGEGPKKPSSQQQEPQLSSIKPKP